MTSNRHLSINSHLGRLACGFGLLAAAALIPASALAQVDGVSYTLTPTYNAMRWDKELGISDTELWGGRFSLNFGKYIALQSYYLTRNNVETDFGSLSLRDINGDPLANQDLNISNYGADVVLNLGSGNIVPFLKGGGGIIQFDPETGDKVKQINAKAGGGFRFGVSRLQAEVYVEDSAFRINRYDLASGDKAMFPEDPDNDKIKHNLSAGVGLNFLLGGYKGDALNEADQAVAERFRSGLSGLSIPLEPFVGRLDWNDKAGTDNQKLFGVRTGLDFGRFFGLRGYYWRGVNDDLNKTQPIESFGGEAQFNLSSGKGVVPYLVGGVGQINYTEDGDNEDGEDKSAAALAMKDKTALILGGGLSFRLGDRLKLNASARDYIMSMDALEDISTTDNLQSNWLFSASLGFNLFGHGPDGQKGFFAKGEPPAPPAPKAPAAPAAPVAAPAAPAAPVAAPAAPAPTTGATWTAAPGTQVIKKDPEGNTFIMAAPGAPGSTSTETVTPGVIPPVRNYAGDRIIAIPVPVEGEIYIRYGQPGGVNIQSKNQSSNQPAPAAQEKKDSGEKKDTKKNDDKSELLDREDLRSIIREELAQSGAADFGGLTSEQQMELLERRLDERLEGRVNQRVNERMAAMGSGSGSDSPSTIIVSGSGDKSEQVRVNPDGTVETIDSGNNYKWSFRGYRFYTGFGIDDPEQFVLGTRINLGPLTENSRFHLIPELAFGFGSDLTSTMIAANLQWDFKTVAEKGDWSPYISTGPAWLNFSGDAGDGSDLYLNAAYGVTMDLGRMTGFAEHQGIGFFDHNRILAGVKFKL